MKTNYIPHSSIVAIYPTRNKDYQEAIGIDTKEGSYTTSYAFTTDSNGIHGEFYKEEIDNDFSALNELSKNING